jgi:lipid-A-disaccharide synthase-like uncharacterized protein
MKPRRRRVSESIALLLCCSAVLALAACLALGDEDAPAAAPSAGVDLKVPLRGADEVTLVREADGSYRYLVHGAGGQERLTPEQFAQRVYSQRSSRGLIEKLFNITSPIGIAWVTFGFLGQVLFTGRMIVQWFVSERERRSVVPVAFWWMSLTGGMMLLTYFIWRKDIVGVLGQCTGVVVYSRNLVLIYRRPSLPMESSKPAAAAADDRPQSAVGSPQSAVSGE